MTRDDELRQQELLRDEELHNGEERREQAQRARPEPLAHQDLVGQHQRERWGHAREHQVVVADQLSGHER